LSFEMRPQDEQHLRRLSLTLTSLVLLLSLCTSYALQYLPSDPLHLRRNFTLYSLFVAIISAGGVYGAVKRNATLLSLFASHLLLDSILYLIPRILLLNFTFSLPALVCSPFRQSSRNVDVYRVHRNPRMAQNLMDSKRCQTMSWAIEWSVISGALAFMILQFLLALKVRRYAQYLDDREAQIMMEAEKRSARKGTYKDIC